MRGQISEETLHRWLSSEGFILIEFEGNGALWGYTHQTAREVGLWVGLRAFQRVPTLLHECIHIQRGDDGHQPQAIEDRIDEEVAWAIIDPAEYAFWEMQYEGSAAGISTALETPRWVVHAYQRRLAREAVGVRVAFL